MRSPDFSSASRVKNTADMPVEVARQASAPSRAARRFSNMLTVGLPKREYW